MLEGSGRKRRRNCWMERTHFERGLLALLVLTVIIILVFGIVLVLNTRRSTGTDVCGKGTPSKKGVNPSSSDNPGLDSSEESCSSLACVQSASEILGRIDTKINPCQNFYEFACNNVPANSKSYFYTPLAELIDKEMSRIEEMFMEPIGVDDHPLVQVQKIMYDACMNKTAIAEDAVRTLKQVLKMVGGWPVLEQQWSDAKFDWVQTTYKLRQLGYTYNSFLELKIVPDPNDPEKYIFEVSIPEVKHIYSKWFDSDDNSAFMTDVALALGGEIHRVLEEMTNAYQFLNHLQWQRNSIIDDRTPFHRATVAEFQRREDAVNWVEFINTIAGPDITVSVNDVVLFPPEGTLDEWFGLLKRTPSRTLANYMLWRVVEEALPYLTDQLVNARVRPRLTTNIECETRSLFCIHEINKRFSPSPINVMYLRKYLPRKKRVAVEEVVNNMKLALLDVTKEVEWLDSQDKTNIVNEINDLAVVVGAPGNYFEDNIFDMKFDLDISTNNFLKLLSQANRNNQDHMYRLIEKSPSDTEIMWASITAKQSLIQEDNNAMNILASIVQAPLFSEDQPNYLNYANLGILARNFFLDYLAKVESIKGSEAIEDIAKCLLSGVVSDNSTVTDYVPVDGFIAHKLAIEVSHKAYKSWIKDKQEPSIVALDYTSDQLFWMSSGYIFCHYKQALTSQLSSDTKEVWDLLVLDVINDNPKLSRDFNCAEIPEETCKLF